MVYYLTIMIIIVIVNFYKKKKNEKSTTRVVIHRVYRFKSEKNISMLQGWGRLLSKVID